MWMASYVVTSSDDHKFANIVLIFLMTSPATSFNFSDVFLILLMVIHRDEILAKMELLILLRTTSLVLIFGR